MTLNETYFKDATPEKVAKILEDARKNKTRIRIFYGDAKTGRDWCETYDVMGYVGRSCGEKKIPLLIHKSNSMGGGAILDDCIVKITIEKNVVYQHPKYHLPKMEIREVEDDAREDGFTHCIIVNEKPFMNVKSLRTAENAIKFFKGERNVIG